MLVREGVHDDLIDDLGLMRGEYRSMGSWPPRLKCLTNSEASLTWLTIRDALWVDKRSFVAGLVASPEGVRCRGMEEATEQAFFHCPAARPLCELCSHDEQNILHPGCNSSCRTGGSTLCFCACYAVMRMLI